AIDHERNEIPWIRYTNTQTGEQTIFQSEYDPLVENELDEHEIRTMDCMDCHNRPSHSYKAPFSALNELMFSGDISRELPEIKSTARNLLTQEYSDSDSAVTAIREGITEYYRENYPDIYQNNGPALSSTISSITEYYKQNFFPLMKARWDRYPSQLGHLEFPGCYRCHDGAHVSESGKTITNECNACHTIVEQSEMVAVNRRQGLEFKHPIDIGEAWKDMACYECHSPDNY
ncbi:cytochrome C, partial [candidate division KSB1 bacterium]